MVFIVIGGIFAVLAGWGGWYTHRMRRRGDHVSLHGDATLHQTEIDLTRYQRR
jgi:hypothetical protein